MPGAAAVPWFVLATPSLDGWLAGTTSREGAALPRYVRHDEQPRPIYFLEAIDRAVETIFKDLDLTDLEKCEVAVGAKDSPPTSGTWSLSYDGSSTGLTALSATISEAALQTALNANAAVTADGGVTVVKTGSLYTIRFATVGAKDDFTAVADGLVPASDITVEKVTNGSVSEHEVWSVWLLKKLYAYSDDFVPIDTSSGTVAVTNITVGSASAAASYRVAVSLDPIAGAFPFTYSLPERTLISVQANTAASQVVKIFAPEGNATVADVQSCYLHLRSLTNTKIRVWLNIDGGGAAPPAPAGGSLLAAAIVTSTGSAPEIAWVDLLHQLSDAIDADAAFVADWTTTLRVTSASGGVRGTVDRGTLNALVVSEETAGSAGQLGGHGFILPDQNGTAAYYCTVGGLPAAPPAWAAAASRQTAVAVAGGASANTAAGNFQAALAADAQFTASTAAANVVTAIDSFGGDRANDASSSNTALFGVVQNVAGDSIGVSIDHDETASDFEAKMGGLFTVAKAGNFSWTLTRTALGVSSAPAVAVGTLTFRQGVTGTLSFRRQSLRQEFALQGGSGDLECYTEIKLTFTGSLPRVVLNIQSTITRDLIIGTAMMVPWTVMDSAGFKWGVASFSAGDQEKAVMFATAFDDPPRAIFPGEVQMEASGDDVAAVLGVHTISETGFTLKLAAEAPADCEVPWMALL